ncbi:hypothetical protein AOLI_G00057460 [Acnodon oligacanthus]
MVSVVEGPTLARPVAGATEPQACRGERLQAQKRVGGSPRRMPAFKLFLSASKQYKFKYSYAPALLFPAVTLSLSSLRDQMAGRRIHVVFSPMWDSVVTDGVIIF